MFWDGFDVVGGWKQEVTRGKELLLFPLPVKQWPTHASKGFIPLTDLHRSTQTKTQALIVLSLSKYWKGTEFKKWHHLFRDYTKSGISMLWNVTHWFKFPWIDDYLAVWLILKNGLRKVRGERKDEKALMRKLSDPLGSCSFIFPPKISQGEAWVVKYDR